MLGTEFFDLGDFLRDLSTNDLLHVLQINMRITITQLYVLIPIKTSVILLINE